MKDSLIAAFCVLLVGCSAPATKAPEQKTYVELPPYAFSGNFTTYKSPAELLLKVKSLGGPQQEFETDAKFSDRISKLGNSAVLSPVKDYQLKFDKASGAISFSAHVEDAQAFGYRASDSSWQDFKHRYLAISLPEDEYVKGSYVGQNAFGAQATVDVTETDRVYLVAPPIPASLGQPLFVTLKGDLSITAEELKADRDNIRLAVMFQSIPKYLSLKKSYGTATITNKKEATINNYFFDVRIAGLSVINIKTNKVYSQRMRVDFK